MTAPDREPTIHELKTWRAYDVSFLDLRTLWIQMRVHAFDWDPATEAVWLLPDDRFPGATELDGLPVERYDGPPRLAFREATR